MSRGTLSSSGTRPRWNGDITLAFGFFALIRADARGVPAAPEIIVVFDGQDSIADRTVYVGPNGGAMTAACARHGQNHHLICGAQLWPDVIATSVGSDLAKARLMAVSRPCS